MLKRLNIGTVQPTDHLSLVSSAHVGQGLPGALGTHPQPSVGFAQSDRPFGQAHLESGVCDALLEASSDLFLNHPFAFKYHAVDSTDM